MKKNFILAYEADEMKGADHPIILPSAKDEDALAPGNLARSGCLAACLRPLAPLSIRRLPPQAVSAIPRPLVGDDSSFLRLAFIPRGRTLQ